MKISLFLILLLSSSHLLANNCIKIRAAFDIGSGSTKMKVAKVDTCTQKIISILYENSLPVFYKQSLQDSNNKTIDAKTLNTGFKALQTLKNESLKYSPTQFFAAATSAFRTATNLKSFKQKVLSKLKINIKIISQTKEAKLGFIAASSLTSTPMKDVIVWDIGGGSMQITSFDGKKFEIYEGKHAAVTFKDFVIETIQVKDRYSIKSPNPLKQNESNEALLKAFEFANKEVSKSLKKKIDNGAQVLGIGGLHYYSIKGQATKSSTYTLAQVLSVLKKNTGLTDIELNDKYSETQVTNLALVGGFMKALNIKKVLTGNINLADGLLINPEI
jgi:exopolyphosphatase/guanosine-5'-triphosphate,3'-diphosphate pyrophosphatase